MILGIDKYFVPIIVQRPTTTTDEWGNIVQTWSTHLTADGLIRQLSGNDVVSSFKDTPIASHRMYCRLADIQVKDRIVYKNQTLDIIRVNNLMNFDELLQVDMYHAEI